MKDRIMWFEALLQKMTKQYLPRNKNAARRYIQELLQSFKIKFYPDESIPIDLRLGILDKLFAYFSNEQNKDITLKNFAQTFFGLLIIYTKYIEDENPWLFDFSDMMEQPLVCRTLGALQDEYSIYSASPGKIERQGLNIGTLSTEQLARARTKHLRRIEAEALHNQNFSMTLNYANLSQLFIQFRNKNILSAFSQECLNQHFQDKQMNALIDTVSATVSIGYCQLALPLRIWNLYNKKHLSEDEHHILRTILSLETRLTDLKPVTKTNPSALSHYRAIWSLEKKLLRATLTHYADDIDHPAFMRLASQAIKSAKTVLNDRDWKNKLDDLLLACSRLGKQHQSGQLSRYFAGDLFFPPAPAKLVKPVRALTQTDSYSFLTQSF